MSDIKRLVSAATAQWLPVALGALAIPSGARHQRKSPQSQGPSACVLFVWNMVNVITSLALWEPPWKGPHSEATKVPFCFFSSAFSLFIYLCVGEPDEEGGLSLYHRSLSTSLTFWQAAWPITAALLLSWHHKSQQLLSRTYALSVSNAFSLKLYSHLTSAQLDL